MLRDPSYAVVRDVAFVLRESFHMPQQLVVRHGVWCSLRSTNSVKPFREMLHKLCSVLLGDGECIAAYVYKYLTLYKVFLGDE